MAEMTEEEFAAKISWEGGVIDALESGLRPSHCAPGPLREAYLGVWMVWDAAFRTAMRRVDAMVQQYEEFGSLVEDSDDTKIVPELRRKIMAIDKQDVDRIVDATVYDRHGDKVGRVNELYVDAGTRAPLWVTVSRGFFDSTDSYVPLDDATLVGDRLTVPYSKSLIKNAPRLQDNKDDWEDELYLYYGLSAEDPGVADELYGENSDVTDHDHGTASMTAAEESLRVGTEEVEAGRARLSKQVTSEEQTVTVPVEKEVLRVEREPLRGDTRARIDPDSEVEEIVLHEERPVVSKEVHATERVTVGKDTVTEQQVVSGEVQKEHIEIEEDTRTL